jgi:hypothetical protein
VEILGVGNPGQGNMKTWEYFENSNNSHYSHNSSLHFTFLACARQSSFSFCGGSVSRMKFYPHTGKGHIVQTFPLPQKIEVQVEMEIRARIPTPEMQSMGT